MAIEEPGCEEIARAGRVDHADHRFGRHFGALAARHGNRAVSAAGHDQHRHLVLQSGDPGVEIVEPGQRRQFDMVGEQYVDLPFGDQRAEIIAVAIDHEGIGQGEGHLPPGIARGGDGPAHRGARLCRIPQIPFEVEHLGGGNGFVVERGGRQELRGAEESVHRPLAIGRHEDQAARRRRIAGPRRHIEGNPAGPDIVGKDLAQLVVGHLADEGALRPQRSQARQGIGGGTARNLARGAHRVVQCLRPFGIDQGHAATGQAELVDQVVGARCHHVDDGIADRDHVGGRCSHGRSLSPGGNGNDPARLAIIPPQGKMPPD